MRDTPYYKTHLLLEFLLFVHEQHLFAFALARGAVFFHSKIAKLLHLSASLDAVGVLLRIAHCVTGNRVARTVAQWLEVGLRSRHEALGGWQVKPRATVDAVASAPRARPVRRWWWHKSRANRLKPPQVRGSQVGENVTA